MKCKNNWLAMGLFLTLLGASPALWAHPSPTEVIEMLSGRIAQGERTAKLFARRGDEYRVVGEDRSAVADYLVALEIEKNSPSALYGLARTYYTQQDWDRARKAANRGIQTATSGDLAAPFYAVLAKVHDQQGANAAALTAWQKALEFSRPEVNWYLGQAKSLKQLGRLQKARQSLETAMQKNPSVVLRRTWLHLLIECGETETAAQHIEAGLARSRWKSSWLLLRAKLHQAQSHHEAAQQDAQAVLEEINLRSQPGMHNPYLAAARRQALNILRGNR